MPYRFNKPRRHKIPRARYRVAQNRQTRALLLLGHLPVRVRDFLIARSLPRYP